MTAEMLGQQRSANALLVPVSSIPPFDAMPETFFQQRWIPQMVIRAFRISRCRPSVRDLNNGAFRGRRLGNGKLHGMYGNGI
jgi:hypothetical protein